MSDNWWYTESYADSWSREFDMLDVQLKRLGGLPEHDFVWETWHSVEGE